MSVDNSAIMALQGTRNRVMLVRTAMAKNMSQTNMTVLERLSGGTNTKYNDSASGSADRYIKG